MDIIVEEATAPLPVGFAKFVQDCTSADQHPPFGEHTLLMLDGQRQVRHAVITAGSATSLQGVAVLSEGLECWYVELAVRPDRRRLGIAQDLLAAARAHVGSHGGGVLRAWAHAAAEVDHPAQGWSRERTLMVLTRPLAAGPTPSSRIRNLDPTDGQDRDRWLDLSNAAFLGHPENGGWARSEVDWRMDSAWTDGRCFPVIEDGSGLMAGVWTKRCDADGELYVVAVHPRAQGQGLGRLVVEAALSQLAAAGCRTASLYVDADNAPARRLYDKVGFGLHHIYRCYQIQVLASPAAGSGVRSRRPRAGASGPPER